MEKSEQDDEPPKKRPHLSSPLSPSMSPNAKHFDVSDLQFENQKLVHLSETKKQEMHHLEGKIQVLKDKQTSYDDELISFNQTWNQLVDDLTLLGVQAGGGPHALRLLDHNDYTGGSIPSCSAEDMFLCRLLGVNTVQRNGSKATEGFLEESLASRQSATMDLVKSIKVSINSQRMETSSIAEALRGNSSLEDTLTQLSRIDDMMKVEAKNLQQVLDVLFTKQKECAEMIRSYENTHATEESEIRHLEGNLDETTVELEETRRKLVNLRMEKDAATELHAPTGTTANGSLSPEKPADRSKGLRELKESIDEAKILADDRLSELQEAQAENEMLSKELEDLQNTMKDDKHILSSRLYTLINDQVQHWSAEAESYKTSTDSLQSDRSFVLRREKEVNARMETADAARNAYNISGSKIEELELQLKNLIKENNDLEIEMEEAVQDSGREDIKAEFRIMASALSKEMGVMEAQVNRWKETADEAVSLREEYQTLEASLSEKIDEERMLMAKCAEQDEQIKSLEDMIEKARKENLENQLILEMHMQEGHDNRDVQEIRESERRAHQQAEMLRKALEEHSLELRVKAANEAEAACQQRLANAEAELAGLRSELDTTDRDVLEVKEAIKSKDREAEAYISEIETIGQSYEDMQLQNQRLLQQLAERDGYNLKLVSESVKMKQAQNALLTEKHALVKQLQQNNTSLEAMKSRIVQSEEQMKAHLAEGMKYTDEGIQLALANEIAKWELMDAEKELKWLRHALASSEKEDEQMQKKIEESHQELELEKSEKSKLEEELKELNDMVVKLTSETGEAAVQQLQDEIKDCKSILKCSVCSDRPKEVVIVKCYHLFCNPCIQRNLEIRHRKCPACGTAFGQNDVRFVKI